MPVERKAYGCKWGCRKVYLTKLTMEQHEARCFHNPIRKACATCELGSPYLDEKCDLVPAGKRAHADCKGWEPKREWD